MYAPVMTVYSIYNTGLKNVYNKWYNHKINRGHLLAMTNIHTKSEDPRSMCCQVIDQTRFWASVSLWPWPRNPKFNRGILLVMTNYHSKLEYSWAMSSLVIDWTRFVYGQTDIPTDMCKAIYPHFFEGGHNYNKIYLNTGIQAIIMS